MSDSQSGFGRLPAMSRYALIAIGVLVLLVAAVAVLSGGGDDGAADDGAASQFQDQTSTEGEPMSEEEREALLDEAGIAPEPDAATADAYLAALDAIDPEIDGDDPESAISRGRDTCRTIHDHPDDRAQQIEQTNQRFTHPDHPDGWGRETAERILDAAHEHLCPSY
ncbi:DUF732 domain-containing protein [Streptomyces sp. B6B3]|uniref:DUF732 domain-containing protein n=1 Tax=Streptomyces sp. B6B3 TaxID=3153570 RepID=UPI00325E48B8